MALPDSDKVIHELNRRFNVAERNIMELKKNYRTFRAGKPTVLTVG